jgi:hypothetical protein
MARGCAAPELSELFARHVPRHGRDLSRTCMGLKLESPGEIDPMPNQNVPTMIKVWFDKRNIREDSEAIAKEGALKLAIGDLFPVIQWKSKGHDSTSILGLPSLGRAIYIIQTPISDCMDLYGLYGYSLIHQKIAFLDFLSLRLNITSM